MSERDRARVAMLGAVALVVALAVSVVLVIAPGEDDAVPEDAPRSSRVQVPRTPSGPRPLVVAWEMSQCDRPSFVLYDDGSWLRDPLEEGRCGEELLSGRLAPLVRDSLHRAIRDAGLELLPAETYVQALGGGYGTTIAVHEGGETWTAAAVVGFLPRRPRAIHELAARDVVMPEAGSWVLPVRYERPVPEPFLAANDRLVELDLPAESRTTTIPASAEIEALRLRSLGVED